MAKKTDKSKQIVHEAELTRQHARYKIPAQIEIEGTKYKVYDWSVSGVGIEGLPDELFNKKFVVGRMIFKFDDFETVIDNLKIEFVIRKPDGVVGGRFTEQTPQQIAILNQIISAYLAGDIVTEDDIIHAVTRSNFMQKKEKKTQIDKKKSIMVLLLLWAFVIFLVLFLLFVMYQRIYLVKTENAYFDANISVVRAPSPSYIEFAKDFKPNEEINRSEILMYSHLLYGGIKVVKSPFDGYIYKTMIKNGDFRNVGEPVFAVLKKNYSIYIVAHVLHKDLIKLHIGDIGKVSLSNGDTFYAKIEKIIFPYKIVAQHSKPLENVYNQPRNYDRIILKPINYMPNIDMIGESVNVIIDTFLNKHGWYSIEETDENEANETEDQNGSSYDKNISFENNYTEKNESVKIFEKSDINKSNVVKWAENNNSNNRVVQNTVSVSKKIVTAQNDKNITSGGIDSDTKENIFVKKYCIIAASSPKPFKDYKTKKFLSDFSNAKVVKVGKIYEIKIEAFDTYKQAKTYMYNNVKTYYKDAFIIKCKVKKDE